MINPCYRIVKGNIDEICNKIPSQFDKVPLYVDWEIMRVFLRDSESELIWGIVDLGEEIP